MPTWNRRSSCAPRELAQSVGELRALGEVSQAVNSTLDLETVLNTIVAKAVQLSGTEAGAIYVLDEATQEFRLRATYGTAEDLIAAIQNQHMGSPMPIAPGDRARDNPEQVADLRDQPPNPVHEIVCARAIGRCLIVPLLGADRVVGALVVRRKAPGEFRKSTVDLLQTFAAQSVLAIQNAHLFHEIEDKSHQLAVASQHKSQFLANMSHELRTPLNAILGYTELILDDIYGEAPDQDARSARAGSDQWQAPSRTDQRRARSCRRSRPGQLTLSLADYSLKDVVHGVFAAVESLATEKKLALKVELPNDLPTGRGDERRLTQVLLNLVGNAIKFTDRGEVAINASATNGALHGRGARHRAGHRGRPIRPRSSRSSSRPTAPPPRRRAGPGSACRSRGVSSRCTAGESGSSRSVGQGATFFVTVPVKVEQQVGQA